MGLTWSEGPFKRRSRPPQKWETPSSAHPLWEESCYEFHSHEDRSSASSPRAPSPVKPPDENAAQPLPRPQPLTPWTEDHGGVPGLPTTETQTINVRCFNTFNLLCSKRKLIHNLVTRMLSTRLAITSTCKQTTVPNLLPGRNGCCSGVSARHFHWQEALKHTVPEVTGGSSHFPFLGKLLLILQTWTQGSRSASSFSWKHQTE